LEQDNKKEDAEGKITGVPEEKVTKAKENKKTPSASSSHLLDQHDNNSSTTLLPSLVVCLT
jgi:hypothetical protein